jgi:hypothetical protein
MVTNHANGSKEQSMQSTESIFSEQLWAPKHANTSLSGDRTNNEKEMVAWLQRNTILMSWHDKNESVGSGGKRRDWGWEFWILFIYTY